MFGGWSLEVLVGSSERVCSAEVDMMDGFTRAGIERLLGFECGR